MYKGARVSVVTPPVFVPPEWPRDRPYLEQFAAHVAEFRTFELAADLLRGERCHDRRDSGLGLVQQCIAVFMSRDHWRADPLRSIDLRSTDSTSSRTRSLFFGSCTKFIMPTATWSKTTHCHAGHAPCRRHGDRDAKRRCGHASRGRENLPPLTLL